MLLNKEKKKDWSYCFFLKESQQDVRLLYQVDFYNFDVKLESAVEKYFGP